MDDLAKVKERIAKLLAKAQGTDNEHEAASFMEKVEAELDKYQLELWEVTSHDDPMGFDVGLEGTSSSPTWQRHLICAIASYYDCRTVRRRGFAKQTGKGTTYDNFAIDIIGRESSRVTVQLMYPFVLEQVRQAGRKLYGEGHKGSAEQLIRRVANALVFRIRKLIDERARKEQATPLAESRNVRALVVVEELKAFIDNQYGELGVGRAKARNTTHAAARAACGISIERQVRGSSQLRLGRG